MSIDNDEAVCDICEVGGPLHDHPEEFPLPRGASYVADDGLVGKIIAYENGDLTYDEILAFFGELIETGLAWQLQGSYGRMAASLIESGEVIFA